jgi:FkbM family methyltransferase
MSIKEQIRASLPKWIKPHRVLRGKLRGSWIITSWHDYPSAILGYAEQDLLDWFFQNISPGETWLDIGAHYGFTAIALARIVGEQGRIFAFEPMVSTAGSLLKTSRLNHLNQVTVIPFGLSSSPSLELITLPTFRGMADRTLQGKSTVERIFTCSLDGLWKSINLGNPSLQGIKIDVQGMELEVLQGMNDVLTRNKPKLLIEVHTGIDREVLGGLLVKSGYKPNPYSTHLKQTIKLSDMVDDQSYAFYPG